MRLLAIVVVALLVVAARAGGGGGDEPTGPSSVLILDPSNFDNEIGGDLPALVEFFAPWCGHCKSLAPEYEILAQSFAKSPVKIASVDADKHRELGSRFGVSGFPTIKYFPAGSTTPEDYSGGRTAGDMVDFINKKAGTNARVKQAASAVVQLDASNFDQIVGKDKDVLVEFYAPWCGHCKRLTPDYEKTAQSLEGEDSVVIAKVDADAEKALGSRFGVSGYPTLKWFPRGNTEGEAYNGGRSPKDFVEFVNEKSGTERLVGGGFLESAGRTSELDALAAKFLETSSKAEREAIAKEADAFKASGKNAEFAKFYGLIMNKIIKSGDGAVGEETARLQRLLAGGGITPKSAAQFNKRINIVSQFKQ